MIYGSVTKRGRDGMTFALHAIETQKAIALVEKLEKGVRSEKVLGVSNEFVNDIRPDASPIRVLSDQATKHDDHYQYDEETGALLVNGRVYSPNQKITHTTEQLAVLAEHIVEHLLELLKTPDLDGNVNYALLDKACTAQESELTILILHNAMWNATCIQTMHMAFELLLRDHIKTRLAVLFKKSAGQYLAYINGADLAPKRAVRKLHRQLRTIQADLLGVDIDHYDRQKTNA